MSVAMPPNGRLPAKEPFRLDRDPNDVTDFSNKYLGLYVVQPNYMSHPWYYAHREGVQGAVHAVMRVHDQKGDAFVHLIKTRRPPLNKPTWELPAGLWGDQEQPETALDALKREGGEETGYHADQMVRADFLAPNFFPTSPGLTTEQKKFGFIDTQGEPGATDFDASEKETIIGKLDLPWATWTDYSKFVAWLQEQHHAGIDVGLDVIAARGLMPPIIEDTRLKKLQKFLTKLRRNPFRVS